MKQKVTIIHGYRGKPWIGWYLWLRLVLARRGYNVWAPQMPRADEPDKDRWTSALLARKGWDYQGAIVIGHSAGSVEVLNLLSSLPKGVVVEAAVIVSPFRPKPEWPKLATLLPAELDFARIKASAKKIIIVHAVDDPTCPVADGKYYAAMLGAKLHILPKGGHFNILLNLRYWHFPELLEILEKEAVISRVQ